jgi:hypothetical protein
MTNASAALTPARSRRGRPRGEHDLTHDVRAYVIAHPYSTTNEIATGIRKRKSDVYAVLLSSEEFGTIPPPPGRSPKAKPWIIVSEATGPVPEKGTGAE